VFGVLQDWVMRATDYWRALFGGIILFLVLAFPEGLAGISRQIETLWQLYRPAVGVVRREKLT
jgi:branched-chain amino acid transport system permease protein